MELLSLGGLVPGLRTEDLFLGISQPRNAKLANVFYRLKHIEACGTGLRRIMQHYEELPEKPAIAATHGAFVLTLPNMNHIMPLHTAPQSRLKAQHQIILDYMKEKGSVTNETIQQILSVKQTRAYVVIREMWRRV
jgi:ATP-dependent DNA helicase RecG